MTFPFKTFGWPFTQLLTQEQLCMTSSTAASVTALHVYIFVRKGRVMIMIMFMIHTLRQSDCSALKFQFNFVGFCSMSLVTCLIFLASYWSLWCFSRVRVILNQKSSLDSCWAEHFYCMQLKYSTYCVLWLMPLLCLKLACVSQCTVYPVVIHGFHFNFKKKKLFWLHINLCYGTH